MSDKERLVEIISRFIGHIADYPQNIADAIIAAGFGDIADYKDEIRTKKIIVEQHFRREVRLVEWVDELRKRVAELEAIAQRAGDVGEMSHIILKQFGVDAPTKYEESARDISRWILNS
jgi:hypothetical protein